MMLGRLKNVGANLKIQKCSKLPEMAKKCAQLVGNVTFNYIHSCIDFGTPPPPLFAKDKLNVEVDLHIEDRR